MRKNETSKGMWKESVLSGHSSLDLRISESRRHNRPTSKLIKLQKKLRKHQQSNSTTYRCFNHRNNLGKLPTHAVEKRWEPSQRKSQRQRAHKLYQHIFPGTRRKGALQHTSFIPPVSLKSFAPKIKPDPLIGHHE